MIEKSAPRITDWNHEACRVMTLYDREGQIFLSHPQTNNEFHAHHYVTVLIFKTNTRKRLPEVPEYAELRHNVTWRRHFNITMTLRIDVRPTFCWRVAVRFYIFPKTADILIWCARKVSPFQFCFHLCFFGRFVVFT